MTDTPPRPTGIHVNLYGPADGGKVHVNSVTQSGNQIRGKWFTSYDEALKQLTEELELLFDERERQLVAHREDLLTKLTDTTNALRGEK